MFRKSADNADNSQAPRSSPLGLACELDPSSSCLVMCFDKVDANMMNLAHKLSERGAADTCIGHLRHQSLQRITRYI